MTARISEQRIQTANHFLSAERWRGAYRLAVVNAFCYLALSIVMFLIAPETLPIALLPPALFFVGAMISFVMLVRGGGVFAAIAWFIFGAGVFFGLGTVVGVVDPDPRTIHFVSESALYGNLVKVNLLNATSVAIVLVFAAPLSNARMVLFGGPIMSLNEIHGTFRGIFPFVLVFAVVATVCRYIFFPVAESLLLRAVLGPLYLITPFFLLLVGMLWSRFGVHMKVVVTVVVVFEVLLTVLLMSKFAIMSDVTAIIVGTWINRRSMKTLVASLIVLVACYFVVGYASGAGRAHPDYSGGDQSPVARMEIFKEVLLDGAPEPMVDDERRAPSGLARLTLFFIQSYLINEYDSGQPGDSLDDLWVAMIPRVVWPDKPIVTRFGVELHDLFWDTEAASSALAPSYSGEAYWNYGPVGLVMISALLGLEFGWFTRCWHGAFRGRDPAFFLIALPSAIWAAFVETWIAASYIGGFLTLSVIWLAARAVFQRYLTGKKARLLPAVPDRLPRQIRVDF